MATNADVRHQVSDEEWQVRVDLAACYHLIAMYGWNDLVFTHISARVPGADEHFLINPYGYLFEEITAGSLVKVNLAGDIVLATDNVVNPAGFVIHSAIHAARHDIACVLHTHSKAGVAVSAQVHGLLPVFRRRRRKLHAAWVARWPGRACCASLIAVTRRFATRTGTSCRPGFRFLPSAHSQVRPDVLPAPRSRRALRLSRRGSGRNPSRDCGSETG